MKTRNVIAVLVLTLNCLWPGLAQAGAETVNVAIKKMAFIPQRISVKVGGTVRWTNNERRQYHNVWFRQSGEEEPDIFFPGESYLKRFDTPGIFHYECGPHSEMKGVVHVEE